MPRKLMTYDDQELVRLELSQAIQKSWSSGQYDTLTGLTSELCKRYPGIPRSAIYWLTYHVVYGDGGP